MGETMMARRALSLRSVVLLGAALVVVLAFSAGAAHASQPNPTLNSVACPTASQCTAVDDAGREVTFNPTAPGTPTPATVDPNPVGNAFDFLAVACPTASECTEIGSSGRAVTFNPTAAGSPTPATIDDEAATNGALTGLACPSASQCTAIDTGVRQVTFNPTRFGSPAPKALGSRFINLASVACPSGQPVHRRRLIHGGRADLQPDRAGDPDANQDLEQQ